MSGPTFTHRGVEITISDNGRFNAVAAGRRLWGPSLESIKKKLDQALPFAPFTAIFSGRNGVHEVRIVGVLEDRYGRKYSDEDGKTHHHTSLYADTPENRAAIQAHHDGWAAEHARHEQEKERLCEMRNALKSLPSPEEFKG